MSTLPLRIVLVRHGVSTFNLEHRVQGRDDLSHLTEEGELQSRLTGEALRELGFEAVYSSPLQRARATAETLLASHGASLAPVFDDDLLEIDLSPWSGLLRTEVRALDPEQERRWREAPETMELRRADGSTYLPVPELMEQAAHFAGRLQARHGDGEAVLVVAHNAILRCLVLHLLGLPASAFLRLRLDNASISVLNLARGEGGTPQVQLESLNGTAHLGVPLPAAAAGSRLLLVRHGETDWNREGRFQGQMDIPLNAHGLAQAEAARAFLAPVPMQRAYSSDMARPLRTAEVILSSHPGVPLTTTRGLREIGHGLWEGRLESEIASTWPDLLADWKRTPQTVQMPEGETISEVWDRSLDTWNRIVAGLAPKETALVVAHDAVNKTILCSLLGLTAGDIWTVKQGNGGVTVVDYPRGAAAPPVLASLNLTAHLGGVLDRTAAGAL